MSVVTKATVSDTSDVLLSTSGIAVSVKICIPIMIEQRRKYNGNNLLCTEPKTLRGKFLNMVIPAMNVVYITVPNHVENANRCTDAATLGGRIKCFPIVCSSALLALMGETVAPPL